MKKLILGLFLFTLAPAMGQRNNLFVDVLADDSEDDFLGLPEVQTGRLRVNTVAFVKGGVVPGDGKGGLFLWNGTSWEKAPWNFQNSTDIIVIQGPGIDPSGTDACSDEIQAILDTDEAKGALVYFPPGYYRLDKPLIFYSRTIYEGAGNNPAPFTLPLGSDFRSGTVLFADDTFNDNYPNDYLIRSENWTFTEEQSASFWMHWFQIRDMAISGNDFAANGIGIHRMGEASKLENLQVSRFRDACIRLTGAHAPCSLQNITVGGNSQDPVSLQSGTGTPGDPYVYDSTYDRTGIHLGKHPTLEGSSGDISIIDISGDLNDKKGILRISGGQSVTLVSPKLEFNSFRCITIDDQGLGGAVGTGGGSASLTIIGGSSQDVGTDPSAGYAIPCQEIIGIDNGVTPAITLIGFQTTSARTTAVDSSDNPQTFEDAFGYVPQLIRNAGPAGNIPIHPGANLRSSIISYGTGGNWFSNDITLANDQPIRFTRPDLETTFNAIKFGAGLTLDITAGSSSGLRLRDGNENTKLLLDNNGVEVEDVFLNVKQLTVATLPDPTANTGKRAEVTDATTPVEGAVVVGGGAAACEVRSNGTNWIVIDDGSNW